MVRALPAPTSPPPRHPGEILADTHVLPQGNFMIADTLSREILSIVSTKDDDAFRALPGRLVDLLPRLNERDRRVAMVNEAWAAGLVSKPEGEGGVRRLRQAPACWQRRPDRDAPCVAVVGVTPRLPPRRQPEGRVVGPEEFPEPQTSAGLPLAFQSPGRPS
jgi:hypothetical protein